MTGEGDTTRLRVGVAAVRAGLAVFVLAWILGPYTLRAVIPVWLPFVIALALELQFFFGWRLPTSGPSRPDGLPTPEDRARWGYMEQPEDLLLVRRDGEELWVPYAGEEGEELEELIARERDEAEERRRLREAPPASRSGDRRLPRLLVGLAIAAVLASIVWYVDSRSGWGGLEREAREEATTRFSAEASRVVGRTVSIRCDESGAFVGAVQHADGVAEVGGRLAFLTPERCFDLYRLAFENEVAFSQTARSIAVLAHEAWHLRGIRDEATTECYALQSGVQLGQRLGLSEGTARRMMRQQLAENRLRSGSSAEYLVTQDCRDGGRLDLRPGDSAFP